MQNQMKTHQLSEELIIQLLERVQTGSIATMNADGSPYNTPVHYVYHKGNIYIHGLPKGQKVSNIEAERKVSFTVFEMTKILLSKDDRPCGTNTEYQSVIISGIAEMLSEFSEKKEILGKFVEKYTPHLEADAMPEAAIKATGVIKIEVKEFTGKYYHR